MDHLSTAASSRGGRRRGGRSPYPTGRGSWATPSPSHHHQVGGEGNYVDESSRRMGGLSLGRGGGTSPQISPPSFHRESDQIQTPPPNKVGLQQDDKAAKASVSYPEQANIEPMKKLGFDICQQPKPGGGVKLNASLYTKNREKRNSLRNIEGLNGQVLRPGMVLLKHYLSLDTQVKIVNLCRQLGVGSAGFYQPEFRSGEKMHLKMMCLGSSWEPDIDKYVESRAVDGAKPPTIPQEFIPLVMDAIKDSQTLIAKTSKPASVGRDGLPSMTPSICVVNFYTSSGRLGLHQDKAESPESLRKGLPVVSFSIGDSAEFQYSERRDDVNAGKVLLESGDVLIFGGRSRNIFHGVTSVKAKTAPKLLLDQANLRDGRLNLTFREY